MRDSLTKIEYLAVELFRQCGVRLGEVFLDGSEVHKAIVELTKIYLWQSNYLGSLMLDSVRCF